MRRSCLEKPEQRKRKLEDETARHIQMLRKEKYQIRRERKRKREGKRAIQGERDTEKRRQKRTPLESRNMASAPDTSPL